MLVYSFEYDKVLADNEYLDGVLSNRNADGTITLTLQDQASQGSRREFHCVQNYDFIVHAEPSGMIYAGGGLGPAVKLKSRGAILILTYTNPHVWTGIVQGDYEFLAS
jgi:hypothetical protein